MPDDVATLETKRSKLLEEFLSLGDLRPGSLTAVMRRCGKPSCHCAKRNDPGHDPQFRLTRRVAGKTVTETFPNPTALRSEEHTSELQSPCNLVCRLLLEKKKTRAKQISSIDQL